MRSRLFGRTNLGGKGPATAAFVTELGQHLRCRDAIGDAVMQFGQHRPPVIAEPLDEIALPERTVPIEPSLHHRRDHLEKFGVAARLRQRKVVYMSGNVEVRVRDPFG